MGQVSHGAYRGVTTVASANHLDTDERFQKASDGFFAVRHEVADGIVLHSNDAGTAPVVPSTVPYAVLRRGNDPWEACGQSIPQSSDWHRGREAPVYLAALAGAGRGSML